VTSPDAEFMAKLQEVADAEHARQPVCAWCSRAGEPYEHNGIRFDGLTAFHGERLCPACVDRGMANMPLLVRDCVHADEAGVLYDLNSHTAEWSEKNIPGCRGEPGVTPIAAEYRYTDDVRPSRRRRT
jgi:hypothetical protein